MEKARQAMSVIVSGKTITEQSTEEWIKQHVKEQQKKRESLYTESAYSCIPDKDFRKFQLY